MLRRGAVTLLGGLRTPGSQQAALCTQT